MSAENRVEADCSRQLVQASVRRRRLCTSWRLAPSALGNSTLRGAGRARRRSRFEGPPKGFGGEARSERRVDLTVRGVRFVVVRNVVAEHVRAVGIGAVRHEGIGVGACDGRESNRATDRGCGQPRCCVPHCRFHGVSCCWLGRPAGLSSILVFQAGGVATADTHLTLQLPVIRGSYTSAGPRPTHPCVLYTAVCAFVPP